MDGLIKNMLQTRHEGETALLRFNDISGQFGLTLTQSGIETLQKSRRETLLGVGRVELGGGVIEKLIRAFCTSPYISQSNYEDTLVELQELFYSFKNECRELISDDELIDALCLIFNDIAHGSTEFVAGVDWEDMYRVARTGSTEGTGLCRPPVSEGSYFDEYE